MKIVALICLIFMSLGVKAQTHVKDPDFDRYADSARFFEDKAQHADSFEQAKFYQGRMQYYRGLASAAQEKHDKWWRSEAAKHPGKIIKPKKS